MIDANDFECLVSISMAKENYPLTVQVLPFEFPNRMCFNRANWLICIGCLLKCTLDELTEALQEK